MQVITRSGKLEKVSFDKIIDRLVPLCEGLSIDPINIAKETISNMFDKISTEELDNLSADICASNIYRHPDYDKISSRIAVSNLHKTTLENYWEVTRNCFDIGLVSTLFYQFVLDNKDSIQEMLDYSRDYLFDFFGFKTLERSYLFRNKKNSNKVIERPQHMWMRVSIQIHALGGYPGISVEKCLENIKETYDLLSTLHFTHATPTLFNSGTYHPQMSSCFLMACQDNLEGIFKSISDMAQISKWAGGIGVHLSQIRGRGSHIRGTNGKSDGVVPLCKVIESVGRYVNQGGKRNGSIAVYMEPWHTDIKEFIELRKNTGDENLRTRDLFLALWVPDLFMQRVEQNGIWSLMCPNKCPGLTDVWGREFEELYMRYEAESKYDSQISAKDLWRSILESQIETGMPYMLYKDHINSKSNQKNIGVIKSSNLCAEIVEVSNSEETAVCNLGSICLPKMIDADKKYNFEKLRTVTKILTKNLDKIIDLNFYPTPETRRSNMKNRPVGVGVQGLADVYCILKIPFDGAEARQLNKDIFENIYYAALEASVELAREKGSYETFPGSPFSRGILQFDMWGVQPSSNLDWESLRGRVIKYGTRNSLLTALMPTASTSQIMKNCECFEPYSSNIYVRKTLAGEYIIVNQHLVRDLIEIGLWNKEMYDEILYFNGSVQKIEKIPKNIRDLYKTAFELRQIDIVRQSIDRAPFIDQTQSMNIFQSTPDFSKLASSHFYGWKNGLKTGMYYLRTQPAVDPIKFGLDPAVVKNLRTKYSALETGKKLRDQMEEDIPENVKKVCPIFSGGKIPEGCDVCSA